MGSRPSHFTLTSTGAYRLYSVEELIRMPEPTWQIQDIMPTGGLIGLYAPPGVGKTFLALDMALCIATGRAWQGHAVEPGVVVYISAEGGTGIGKRVAAWLEDRQVKASTVRNLAMMLEAIPISPETDGMDTLIQRINEIQCRPSLIVIDTLARCFDGDENTQEDMGRFIKGVDLLRETFESTVLIVHHTRLDGERERGNTAFRGAADTMLKLAYGEDGEIEFSCTKQKDAEEFVPMVMALKVVPSCQSCVLVVPSHIQDRDAKMELALTVLEKVNLPMKWADWLSSTGMPKSTFHRAVLELAKNNRIIKENNEWRPA